MMLLAFIAATMPSIRAPSLHKVLLIASTYSLRFSAAYTTLPVFNGPRSTAEVSRSMSASAESDVEIEIEKKFAVNDQTSAILKSYGFDVVQKEEFVDWYFDLPAPRWKFCLDDCWFRYREKKVKIMNNWGWRGAWQVKRGRKGTRDTDGMTTYEELQGKAAKELILDMLPEAIATEPIELECKSNSQYSTHDIPYLEGGEQLVPFARVETFRTCWKATSTENEFSGLKVDIDKADSGYMVGEVEALCDGISSKEDVENEKEKIRKFVDLITRESESDDEAATIGKLEFVLMKESPDLYNACVKAGVINEPK
mmetsp:Transcript_1284/g.1877  ORF Transcript_1284/g.1877 Transcript_1284/m.1877 type:complete len:312 (+) Transcript_1284:17-952(+)